MGKRHFEIEGDESGTVHKIKRPDIPDGIQPHYKGIVNEVIDQLTAKVAMARELQIVAALKRAGYEFETTEELYTFAKERCTVEEVNGKQCLYVDHVIYVCEWNATPSVEYWDNRITVTI